MSFPVNQAQFPSTLPRPSADGYAVESAEAADSMQTDSGKDRRRAKYTTAPKKVTLSWLLTQDHLDTLDAFWRNSISNGSMPFSIELWGLGGAGFAWTNALFKEPYQVMLVQHGLYRVSTELLVIQSSANATMSLLYTPGSVFIGPVPATGSTVGPAILRPEEPRARIPFHIYKPGEFASAATPPVLMAPISGVPVEYTLAVFNGRSPLTTSHAIYVAGLPVGTSWTPTDSDGGKSVFVRAVGSNSFSSATSDSATFAVVNLKALDAPTMTALSAGVPVNYTHGTFTGINTSIIHEVILDGVSVGAAWTPSSADNGKSVFIRSTAFDGAYSVSSTSASVIVQVISLISPPSIGTIVIGSPLPYTQAVYSGTEPVTVLHSVRVNNVSQGATWTPTSADIGKSVFVRSFAYNDFAVVGADSLTKIVTA